VPNLGGWELIILLGVLVLVFGAKKLPDMARSVGQSARVLKGEMKGLKQDETPAPPAAPTPAVASPAAVTDR
jgi:sec-independent protein translocase protein TatA